MKHVKRLKKIQIIDKWLSMIGGESEVEGELICYSNHTGNFILYNDGRLYFYEHLLAEIIDGVHTVYDHTASGGSFISKSVSYHVNFLKEFALNIINYNDVCVEEFKKETSKEREQ